MEWLRRLKINKDSKSNMWLIAVLIGIVMMVMPQYGNKSDAEKDTQVHISTDEYISYIETRLENAISDIEGVGNVRVTVTLQNNGEIVVASDEKETSYGKEKSLVMVDNQPLILTEKQPLIEGVVITASGAGSVKTREKIISAAKTLSGAEAHRIAVFEKK